MLSRVAVVFTGGTISMQVPPGAGGPVPTLAGADILARLEGLGDVATIDAVDFALAPGPHMTPELMRSLAQCVAARRADPAVAGVVVTHGTDTLEETAYLLDLVLAPGKPVVFVGAMRHGSEASWDGPANLHAAVRVAAAPAARDLGVVVVLNGGIHAAGDVIKTHTSALDTFAGRDFGPLGWVEPDAVIIGRRPAGRRTGGDCVPVRLDSRVEIIALPAGADGRLVELAAADGVDGLVLEGLGRGNVPITALPAVRRVLGRGLPVVIASRCPRGRVLDTYAYEGAGRELRRAGAILGGYLPAHKARIKLMLLLGLGRTPAEISAEFGSGF